MPAAPREHPGGVAGQHQPPTTTSATTCSPRSSTRRMTYSVRLVRRRRGPDHRPCTSRRPSSARSTASSTRPASARAPGCWRSAPAGARWPSAPPQRGAAVTTVTLSRPSSSSSPRERVEAAGLSAPRRPAAAGLPRGRGAVRRDRQRRDGRGGRRGVLADLLRDPRPAARPRRQGRHAGDHDGARPDAGHRGATFGWIQKYIFPGGLIPSLAGHRPDARRPHHAAGERRGASSARTTPARCGCGGSASPRTGRRSHALGFDETFRRMWEFYLAYCEAGFRTGYLGVSQLQLTRAPAWG